MVKVQRLQVLVARRLSHLDKGDDVRMINIEKGRIRAAARRTLTIGKARGVINLQVRHHADAFFVGAADADMNAHAAAQHGAQLVEHRGNHAGGQPQGQQPGVGQDVT